MTHWRANTTEENPTMIDTSVADATSSAAASITAPVKAAGDTVAETLSSLVDTAAKRGRKARKQAQKRARDEVGHQRRNVVKAANKTKKQSRKAKKQSRKAWADFADETATRASNIVEASKGGRVKPRGKTRRVTAVLALAGATAVLMALKKQGASSPDKDQSQLPTDAHSAALDD
jgi:F0F1-type ATP synthase membrane subunit b/b'